MIVYLGVQRRGHPGHDRKELRRHLLRQPPGQPGTDCRNGLRKNIQDGGPAHGERSERTGRSRHMAAAAGGVLCDVA